MTFQILNGLIVHSYIIIKHYNTKNWAKTADPTWSSVLLWAHYQTKNLLTLTPRRLRIRIMMKNQNHSCNNIPETAMQFYFVLKRSTLLQTNWSQQTHTIRLKSRDFTNTLDIFHQHTALLYRLPHNIIIIKNKSFFFFAFTNICLPCKIIEV